MVNIGFIGLGNMGLPLAKQLGSKIHIKVFDREIDKMANLKSDFISPSQSIEDLGKNCSVIITCLPSSIEVKELLIGKNGLTRYLKPGSIIIDMTSGDPMITRDISIELSKLDIEIVDAPVSGGPKAANTGTISIIVGASHIQLKRIEPILYAISNNVFHAGSLGSGHAIKAGNNLLNLICRLATFEITSILINDGIEPGRAIEILQKSSGRNYTTEITIPDNILSGKMHQGFATGLMKKDSKTALSIAQRHHTDTPMANLAMSILEKTISEYGIESDMSSLALTYEKITGARIRPK